MNKSAFLVATVALVLVACSASNVKTTGPSQSMYAPSNEVSSSGEISYCNAGAKTVRDARRADAYKKMYAACASTGGAYYIVREEDQNPAFCKMERRIWFKCGAQPSGATPAP